jgi:siroheme synthase-like protein
MINTSNFHENTLYPIFLKLEEMQVLIVGGGNVCLEKLESLLKNSPKTSVTIVAPEFNPGVIAFVSGLSSITLFKKEYDSSDLQGKQLVIACTDKPEVNALVKKEANKNSILVNVADTPHLCDFYLSSIVQKGSLKIAISTNGKSPTVAKRIKETLLELLPDSLEEILQRMPHIRNKLKHDFAYKVKKLNELTSILAAKSEIDEY